MHCPTCKNILQKLSVTTNNGGRFDVDHCGHCGGTWFDPYEINRIPYHEVARLSSVTVLPKNRIPQMDILQCPRDHKRLSYFRGESVPVGISLHRCSKCLGIWATQKALVEFKKHQEEVVKEYHIRNDPFPALSMVFAPAIALALLLIFTAVTIFHLSGVQNNRSQASEMVKNISVKNISSSSVLVTFQTKSRVKSFITFGETTLDQRTQTISQEFNTTHYTLLTNLHPSTNYQYQLTFNDVKNIYTTPVSYFMTSN